MSINEKLAELCGKSFVENDGNSFAESCALMGRPMVYEGNGVFKDWNPIKDLNQLKMCYEAAEKDDVFFVERFLDALMVLIRPLCACNIVSSHELTHAIFKHPELVAQAILKAKGVS